ncbi:hypothetical protein OQA88_6938 [Cercophora sp. LCS_1]
MEVQLTRRPAASCYRYLLSTTSSSSTTIHQLRPVLASPAHRGTRQKSTASRTKRALNIPPHPSFLPKPSEEETDSSSTRIIFNPPSSAPSVYHTPFKFLPKSDPRRRANLPATLFASSTTIQYSPEEPSPEEAAKAVNKLPVVRPDHPKVYHVTPEQVQEMRRLRKADPVTNSVTALAKKFACSKLFVMMCCHSTPEHQKQMKKAIEDERKKWGPRKTQAFMDRERRWQMMLDGML